MPAKLKRKLTDVYKIDNVKDRRRERPKKQTRCIEGKDGVRTNSLKQTNDTTEQRVDVRPDSGKQTINDTDSLTNIKPPMKHSNVFAMKIKETGDSYDAPWNTAATNRGVPTAEKDTGDIITRYDHIQYKFLNMKCLLAILNFV